MYIEKNLEQYTILDCCSIREALIKLDRFKGRLLICVDDTGVVQGTLSFGDLNRWLISVPEAELASSVEDAIYRPCFTLPKNQKATASADLLKQYSMIPVVDEQKRLRGILTNDSTLSFGDIFISNDSGALLIAEIGNNHNGSFDRAVELVEAAKRAGAHCVKFQLRTMEALYGERQQGLASDNLGSEYTMDLLSRFQLPVDTLFQVFDYAKSIGMHPLCTPWDEESVQLLDEYGITGFKLASADLTNHGLIHAIAKTGKPVICSTGMASESEIVESVGVLKAGFTPFALLHCNSTYPAPFKDINLLYMKKLREIGDCVVGYSGHERGTSIAIAAVALGAKIIEKHFTLDKTLEGVDHKVSLLPDEFKSMAEGIAQVESALGSSAPRSISQGELMNRVTLAKSIYASSAIKEGEVIQKNALIIRSPGHGMQPNRIGDLVGSLAKKDYSEGDVFYPHDLDEDLPDERLVFIPKRICNWGLPVRHHDYIDMLENFSPPVLEFHLSYKDLELPLSNFFNRVLEQRLVVHAPELFEGDHILDLASSDEEYRNRSVKELRRTMDVARGLGKHFRTAAEPILLVTNVGGFSEDEFLPASEVDRRSEILANTLRELKSGDIEVIPQTMPPFPWHFGGQRFHNLFLDADWIKNFCSEHGYRVCLDLSHSALYCNFSKKSLHKFLDSVLPFTAHLHLADSSGVDGEGLQIGDGEVDWPLVIEKMATLSPHASWIPEVWQGHEGAGRGFRIALQRLTQEGV